MKTYQDFVKWSDARGTQQSHSYYDFLNPGEEVDEEFYWDQLEILPPHFMRGGVFQVGEPADQKNGHYIYSTFENDYKTKKYIWHGLMTYDQANKLYLDNFERVTVCTI